MAGLAAPIVNGRSLTIGADGPHYPANPWGALTHQEDVREMARKLEGRPARKQ